MGFNVGDAPPYKPRHLDFARVAALHVQIEAIVDELGFQIERFEANEDVADDTDVLPTITIGLIQRWQKVRR